MELLRSAVPAIPEFASLSLVVRPEVYSDPSLPMAEPVLVASPSSSIPGNLSLDALKELHTYLILTLGRTEESGMLSDSRVLTEVFKDDQKTIDELQTFRPLKTYGIGLSYRLIRGDTALVNKLATTLLASSQNVKGVSPTSIKMEEDLLGVLLCVGISGCTSYSATSLTQYQIGERLTSCKDVLNVMGKTLELSDVKSLMATMLLHENDYRITNTRAAAVNVTSIPEIDETSEKARGLLGRRNKDASSKATHPDAPEKEEVVLPLAMSSADVARNISENMKILSVADVDTVLRKYTVSGADRKANLDLMGGNTKSRRKRSTARDPDMEHFDYKGPTREVFTTPPMSQTFGNQSQPGSAVPMPKKDMGGKRPNAKSDPGRRSKGATVSSDEEGNAGQVDPFGKTRSRDRRRGREQFADDDATDTSQTRLQVNIALNEDLSCSYRSSQLSSCTVEGVVQVQIKTNGRKIAPFYLLVRDPARHVESFVQNKKFAEDVSKTILPDEEADRKFSVSVPKDETYFPVVRYKCTEDLRPVPMVSAASNALSIIYLWQS
jgi:hypothetical protein